MKSLLMILVLAVSVTGCGKKKKSATMSAFSSAICTGQAAYQLSTIDGQLVIPLGGSNPFMIFGQNEQFYFGSPLQPQVRSFLYGLYSQNTGSQQQSRVYRVRVTGARQCAPTYGTQYQQQGVSPAYGGNYLDVYQIQQI